jgi:4-amino-4-deoxy-L-arabinose transferase-like glycosyltransferase
LRQGLSDSRLWLALVLILFCLPLFIGLRSLDLETDEAIYSFAVDRILEAGDWLQPKSSPSETAVFLEKPPLKFWIVAAPIRVGLLPHDEFGLRFWDALFGGVAFLYVFAIGSLLAGPVCGAVAVMLLFVHWPLLLDHGLRTNNMEGPLFLCYCGGTYHFLRWSETVGRKSAWHAIAVGLYFVLGFMTKFVAAIFLPFVLALGALVFRRTRVKLVADWKIWLSTTALAIALIAPWFVYAYVKFGSELWDTMFAAHVYERFTVGLNQAHVHPWNYYLGMMAEGFTRSGLQWLIPIGVVVLLVQSMRRRWFEGTIVALWGTVPLALISIGSSKLYHYAYPFLPPLTIAAGYTVALVVMLAPVVLRKILEQAEDLVTRLVPRLSELAVRPVPRAAGLAVIVLASVLAVGALAFGLVRVGVGNTQFFKSSGIIRPLAAILVAGILTRRSAPVATLVVWLTVAWWMPVSVYQSTIRQLSVEKHPIRDASDCVRQVEATLKSTSPVGLYVDTDSSMWHPIYYYFRRVRPWTRQVTPAPEILDRNLHDAAALRPSLVQEDRYRDYLHGPQAWRFNGGPSPPMISMFEYVLLLPGPYSSCSPEAKLQARADFNLYGPR